LFFDYRFYHYRIDRLLNDNVVLNGSRAQEKFSLTNDESKLNDNRGSEQMEFPGPMELISYFQKNADPLVTTLSIPCQRQFVRSIFLCRVDDLFHFRIIILYNFGVYPYLLQNCISIK
jgi:hypothetical protein